MHLRLGERDKMVTDTERREISQTLRNIAKDVKDWSCVDVRRCISDAVFRDKAVHSNNELLKTLADLIYPPAECPYYHNDRNYCLAHEDMRVTDRNALLALADEMDGLGLSGFSSGWSSGAVNVGSFARRIREALGVER